MPNALLLQETPHGPMVLVTNVTTASPNMFPILAVYGRTERNVSELLKPWQKRFELIITL